VIQGGLIRSHGKYDIRVNSVHPSTVLTPLVEGIAADFDGGFLAYEQMMTANQSLRRLGRPLDVAYAVLYLTARHRNNTRRGEPEHRGRTHRSRRWRQLPCDHRAGRSRAGPAGLARVQPRAPVLRWPPGARSW
jgi:hypothetical protein